MQQMIGDTNRPTPDQSYAAAESEVVEELKDEAIEQGLSPEDVVQELTDEHYVVGNLEELSEYYGEESIVAAEVINVLEDKEPVKDKSTKPYPP